MIFVTVGTQKFQFNRLFEYIDKLISENIIDSKNIFCQTGFSKIEPKLCKFKDFINEQEFDFYLKNATLIICHGGVGTILKCLNQYKNIIVVPRRKKFNEHIDDHQIEISEKFESLHYLKVASDYESLKDCIINIETFKCLYTKKQTNENSIYQAISNILKENL